MAIADSPAAMNIAERYLQARQAGQVPPKKSVENRSPAVSNPQHVQHSENTVQTPGRYKGRGSVVDIVV